MGRPVVVTDIGGLGETLMPAATGWLVAPDDADGWRMLWSWRWPCPTRRARAWRCGRAAS